MPERTGTLERFVASAPPLQRAGMRALLALASRPRGSALLARLPSLNQLAQIAIGLGRYDEPAVSEALGWNRVAVIERGRALRREQGRP